MKTLAQLLFEYEREIVQETLVRNAHDYEKTATALGIKRRKLDYLLREHGLSKKRFTRPLPFGLNGIMKK